MFPHVSALEDSQKPDCKSHEETAPISHECKRKTRRSAWISDSTKRRQAYTKRGDGIVNKIQARVAMTGCSDLFISVSENRTVHFSGTGDFLNLAMSKYVRKYLLNQFSGNQHEQDRSFLSFSTKIPKIGKDLRTEQVMNSTTDYSVLEQQSSTRDWEKPQLFGGAVKTVNNTFFDGVEYTTDGDLDNSDPEDRNSPDEGSSDVENSSTKECACDPGGGGASSPRSPEHFVKKKNGKKKLKQ